MKQHKKASAFLYFFNASYFFKLLGDIELNNNTTNQKLMDLNNIDFLTSKHKKILLFLVGFTLVGNEGFEPPTPSV